MPLEPRDKRALLWGTPVVGVLLLYLLARGGGGAPSAGSVANDLPATYAGAQPAPIIAAPPVAVPLPVPSAPSADVSQLKLVGLLSRGALIAMPDGSQHFVPVGRELAPGIVLSRVEVHQAVLATAAGEVRLGFDAGPAPGNAVETVQPPRPGMPPTP